MIKLELLTAYWCNTVVGDYEKRFFWAYMEVDGVIHKAIGVSAFNLLEALAKSAPNEYAESNLAAGAFEDYVNLVVEANRADEASRILKSPELSKLLKFTWGEVEELKRLGAGSSHTTATKFTLTPTLQVLSIKDIASFWCKVCSSPTITDYDVTYNKVLDMLFTPKTRDLVIHDLKVSAPDEAAISYLDENVFILRG